MGNLLNIPVAPLLKSHTVSYNRSTILYDSLSLAEVDIVTAQSTADGKITTYRQNSNVTGIPVSTPSDNDIGDLWVDTYDHASYFSNNEFRLRYVTGTETIIGYEYDSGWGNYAPQSVTNKYIWEDIADLGISQAISDAGDAKNTADFKITSWHLTSPPVISTTGLADKDIWFDTSSSEQNMFKYSTSSSADFTGYYWTGSAWSSYGEHSSYGTVQVWIDVDDIKIYKFKIYLTVSNVAKEGEYSSVSEAVSDLPSNGGTIYIKQGTYTLSSSIILSDKSTDFIGEPNGTTIIDVEDGSFNAFSFTALSSTNRIKFSNITFLNSANDYFISGSLPSVSGEIVLDTCVFNSYKGVLELSNVDKILIDKCSFYNGDSDYQLFDLSGYSSNIVQTCSFLNAGSGSDIYQNLSTNIWVTVGDMLSDVRSAAGFGTLTSCISAGTHPTTYAQSSSRFNGYSWSSINNPSVSRESSGGFGFQNSGVITGGHVPGSSSTAIYSTEKFDGVNWSTSGSLSVNRRAINGAASGISSGGLAFGGDNLLKTSAKFNGSVWNASAAMNRTNYLGTGCGVQNSTIAIYGSSGYGTTDVFNGSSWSVGPATLLSDRYNAGCFGASTSSLLAGGISLGQAVSSAEKYNGTSWSQIYPLLQTRQYATGSGESTGGSYNGIIFGGDNLYSEVYLKTVTGISI